MTQKGETTLRIKELFTIPEGKKVTEKVFGRVLVSSICSILLCMACLLSTTWAWFAVSIENTGNVIQTADAPSYLITVDGQDFSPGTELSTGDHTVSITHASTGDDLLKKSTLYVTFSIDGEVYGYTSVGGAYPHSTNVAISNEKPCVLSWSVSWFMPGNPDIRPLADHTIRIIAEDPTEEATEATGATEETPESTAPPEETTETGSVPTEPADEATEPADETTVPSTEPAAEETAPAEDSETPPVTEPADTSAPSTTG